MTDEERLLQQCQSQVAALKAPADALASARQNICALGVLMEHPHNAGAWSGAQAQYRFSKVVSEVLITSANGALHSFNVQLTADSSCLEVDGNVVWFYDVMCGQPLDDFLDEFYQLLPR